MELYAAHRVNIPCLTHDTHNYQVDVKMTNNSMVGLLCLMSHRQRGHLETAPPFTVSCEGREARYLYRSHRESNPGPSRGSPLHNRCATPAPSNNSITSTKQKRRTYYYITCYGIKTQAYITHTLKPKKKDTRS